MSGAGISVDGLLSYCENVLGLASRFDYDHLHGLSCLSLAVHDLNSKSKTVLQSDTIIIKVDEEHEWPLPPEASRVNWFQFPSHWHVNMVSEKRMNEELTRLTAHMSWNTGYPLIGTLTLRASSVLTLTVAPYKNIKVGDLISFTYYNANLEDVNDGGIINLPGLAEATLRYATLWHIAERYEPKRAEEFERKYEKEKAQYFAQIGTHSNLVQYAESREGFYNTEF